MTGEVVADVAVVDSAAVVFGLRIADEKGDGHRRAGALAEYVVTFGPSADTGCPCVAPKIQHVDAAELFRQTRPQPGVHVAVDPRAVGDERDHAVVADAVRRPADGHLVGVVEAVPELGAGTRSVGLADAALQIRIRDVGVVVRRAPLPDRPRRVADDDLNAMLLLPLRPLAVRRHPLLREGRAVGAQVEGVREHDAFERRIAGVRAQTPVVRLLDVDGGDVVGEQHQLVGKELAAELALDGLLLDERFGLQQAN